MKRPILVAVIGYIIGIIVGLCLHISVVPFCFLIIAIYFIYKKLLYNKKRKLKLFSPKRYIKYLKIFINSKVIILLIISSIISNTIILVQNQKYSKIYRELFSKENLILTGIVTSNKEEKQYYNKYKIKTEFQKTKINLYIMVDKNVKLEYGDKIQIRGEYQKPEKQRNYKGFNYENYLKQLKIYGTIKCSKVQIIGKKQANKILQSSNQISVKIIENTQNILDKETASILLGVVLGYKNDINEEIQENFRNASMAHVLAVSGMHIAYVVFGINLMFKKLCGKRWTYIFCIFVLIFYMLITNFAISVTRAGIMGILMLFAKIIYEKNDIYNSISISLFIILIYNPFLILNVGLQLSYCGVLGIIVLNKTVFSFLENIKLKNNFYKYRIRPKIQKYLDKIKKIISISISVQIFIFPIIVRSMNTFNVLFLVSNFVLSIIVGPIVIVGFLFIIVVTVNVYMASLFSNVIKLGIKLLIFVSNIGKIDFAKMYIVTPNVFVIIIYYCLIGLMVALYKIYSVKKLNTTQMRIRNLIALVKIKLRKNIKQVRRILVIIMLLFICINIIPKNLKIYFIDVGQGDSTLIVTPRNQTILIDGGGNKDYDVGKNILLPYLLDRGFNSIDYMLISHFDYDHVRSACCM